MEHDAETDEFDRSSVFGIAALSLLEAIILVLEEKGALTADELDVAFDAAISAHRHRHEAHSVSENCVAAKILSKLKAQGNSVRLE